MTPAQVRVAVPDFDFERVRRGREEQVRLLGLSVDYPEGDTEVTFVQAYRVAGVRVEFAGCDVFKTPADEIVAAVVSKQSLLPTDFPPGRHEYLFPPLRLVLWRGIVGTRPGEQGWRFECISVHAAGYYDD